MGIKLPEGRYHIFNSLGADGLLWVFFERWSCPRDSNGPLASPLTGWLTDIVGAEWITTASMLFEVPWWVVVTRDGSLALFGVSFALQSG